MHSSPPHLHFQPNFRIFKKKLKEAYDTYLSVCLPLTTFECIVTWYLKARIVKPEEMAIARQQLSKSVFSVQSILYQILSTMKGKQVIELLIILPCHADSNFIETVGRRFASHSSPFMSRELKFSLSFKLKVITWSWLCNMFVQVAGRKLIWTVVKHCPVGMLHTYPECIVFLSNSPYYQILF
jgi:hypothetical protein